MPRPPPAGFRPSGGGRFDRPTLGQHRFQPAVRVEHDEIGGGTGNEPAAIGKAEMIGGKRAAPAGGLGEREAQREQVAQGPVHGQHAAGEVAVLEPDT